MLLWECMPEGADGMGCGRRFRAAKWSLGYTGVWGCPRAANAKLPRPARLQQHVGRGLKRGGRFTLEKGCTKQIFTSGRGQTLGTGMKEAKEGPTTSAAAVVGHICLAFNRERL